MRVTIETHTGITARDSTTVGEAIVKALRDHTPLERSVLDVLAEAVEYESYGTIGEGDAARPFVKAAQDYLKYIARNKC